MFRNAVFVDLRIVTALLVALLLQTRADAEDYLPLYRFYNTKIHQHEYTNSDKEAEQWKKDPDKKAEGILGWLPAKPGKGITRLYRARKATGRHYYYTVKPRGFTDFTLDPTVMYVYERKGTGRVGIHGTCLSGGEDMLLTKSRDEVKKVIDETKKGIGNNRRGFYNAFYILEQNPAKVRSSDDSDKKNNTP